MPWSITEIHPLFVHFPIALFLTGFLFDISSFIFEKKELKTAGFYTMFMGLVSSFFTSISGLFSFLRMGTFFDIIYFQHGILQIIVTIIIFILFIIRTQYKVYLQDSILYLRLYFIVYTISIIILLYASHLGAIAAERM